MKIEKETDDKLIITISKEEFKKAFRSFEQLQKFREDLINLLGMYYQCDKELRDNVREGTKHLTPKDPNSES